MFEVAFQNDGNPDRFRVSAGGQGDWQVKYYRGSTNITAAVRAGTYRTPLLAKGSKHMIKVKVYLGDPGTSLARLVTATSTSDATKVDTVRIRMEYSECTC